MTNMLNNEGRIMQSMYAPSCTHELPSFLILIIYFTKGEKKYTQFANEYSVMSNIWINLDCDVNELFQLLGRFVRHRRKIK